MGKLNLRSNMQSICLTHCMIIATTLKLKSNNVYIFLIQVPEVFC